MQYFVKARVKCLEKEKLILYFSFFNDYFTNIDLYDIENHVNCFKILFIYDIWKKPFIIIAEKRGHIKHILAFVSRTILLFKLASLCTALS